MTLTPARLLRDALLAGLAVVWALAAHNASSGNDISLIGMLFATIPVAAIPVWMAWQWAGKIVAAMLAGVFGFLLVRHWVELQQNVAFFYLMQHLGANLSLAALFGLTIRSAQGPLITRMAKWVHGGTLTPNQARYTRQATLAWTVFFCSNATISALLYLLAPTAIWSVFANLLNAPLIGAMFVLDHFWRCHVLQPEERPTVAMAIQAWRAHRSNPSS